MSTPLKKSETILCDDDVQQMVAVANSIMAGDLAARFAVGARHPELRSFDESLNTMVADFERQSGEFHRSNMELALGLSECFDVLNQVRNGVLSARVPDTVLHSEVDLLKQFGEYLNHTLASLEDMQNDAMATIRTLSTPVLKLWDNVLAMPIIGVVDTKRGVEIMETLLSEVCARQTRYVIIDITGVEVVDTRTADHFVKIINAATLLGSQCIVTGIRPAVAQTLVEIGVDLATITTLRNLQEGLQECLARMRASHHGDGLQMNGSAALAPAGPGLVPAQQ